MGSKAKFLTALILCLGGGWITGFFTQSGVHDWYITLAKSPLTPPNSVFPIVWTLLYILMAISLYLVWTTPGEKKEIALTCFGIQLILNFSWSWIFFYHHLIGTALLDILLLWTAIALTIALFSKISWSAAILQVPYLAWVTFAFYLNYYIWLHN